MTQEQQQVFVLNGIQTQSGYCYNLINEQVSMAGLVDVVRLSPQDLSTPEQVALFHANHHGEHPAALSGQKECNGYWRCIPGLAVVE